MLHCNGLGDFVFKDVEQLKQPNSDLNILKESSPNWSPTPIAWKAHCHLLAGS
ncbi:MAG: hypothetical protein RL145_814 [Pseudomonadota bacterium]|jgi:hypothetical protein